MWQFLWPITVLPFLSIPRYSVSAKLCRSLSLGILNRQSGDRPLSPEHIADFFHKQSITVAPQITAWSLYSPRVVLNVTRKGSGKAKQPNQQHIHFSHNSYSGGLGKCFPGLPFVIFKLSGFQKATHTDPQGRAVTWSYPNLRPCTSIYYCSSINLSLPRGKINTNMPPSTYLHHSL